MKDRFGRIYIVSMESNPDDIYKFLRRKKFRVLQNQYTAPVFGDPSNLIKRSVFATTSPEVAEFDRRSEDFLCLGGVLYDAESVQNARFPPRNRISVAVDVRIETGHLPRVVNAAGQPYRRHSESPTATSPVLDCIIITSLRV